MTNRLTVVKVGGKVVETPASLHDLLTRFTQLEGARILVHGGGRSATAMAARLGLEAKMVDGRRITDRDMLDVVVMVYAGLVNKNIVAALQALGVNALGITGADLDYMRSVKRPVKEIDFGFVGDVATVNTDLLEMLISRNVVPVLAPLTHDGTGQMLNTNADAIAAEAAIAFSRNFQTELVYCFEKRGVLSDANDDDSVIPSITVRQFAELKASGTVNAGMLPKLESSFSALQRGVHTVRITSVEGIACGGTRLEKE
ncbi:MAG: acetylglutamate kinase [Bacteroidales bacterium]|jgi:acetylglutamate kinase|nr:acetylglutamate kinase [Bacteroidales bacterium]